MFETSWPTHKGDSQKLQRVSIVLHRFPPRKLPHKTHQPRRKTQNYGLWLVNPSRSALVQTRQTLLGVPFQYILRVFGLLPLPSLR